MEKYIERIEAEIEKAKKRELDNYRSGAHCRAYEEYGIQIGLMLAIDILLNKIKNK